jgi:hypothetical protein
MTRTNISYIMENEPMQSDVEHPIGSLVILLKMLDPNWATFIVTLVIAGVLLMIVTGIVQTYINLCHIFILRYLSHPATRA